MLRRLITARSPLPTLVYALTEISVTLVPGVSDGMVNVVLKSVVLIGCDKFAITNSVGDFITDDDSIGFLRGTPN